jgi:hypothetical protein
MAENEAATTETVKIEAGTRVAVEFNAADARWFEQ